jgi:hypothetical protein
VRSSQRREGRPRTVVTRRLVLHPAFVVPGAVAAAAEIASRHRFALVALVALAVVAGLRVASGFRFDEAVARAAGRVGDAVAFVLGSVVFVLLFLPLHLAHRLRRGTWPDRGAWVERSGVLAPKPTSMGAVEPERRAGRRPVALRAIGLVTVIVVANYLVGFAWDSVSPREDERAAAPIPTIINVSGRDAPKDLRIDAPAMGGVPWAADYFQELNEVQSTYWPFVLYRNEPYAGKYVNGEGWTRRSYEAMNPRDLTLPLLSFYGGSTTFGVGQRDEHTIPSELARVAEAAGYPVRVANHGMNGFVSWQEMHLFEHFTATGERPLRAVFYDGLNEVYAQRQPAVFGYPTDTEVDQIGARVARAPRRLEGPVSTASDRVSARDVVDLYNEHSAVGRLADGVRGVLGAQPAGAAPAEAAAGPAQAPPTSAPSTEAPAAEVPPTTEVEAPARSAEEVGAAAVAVYERSRVLIRSIAKRAGIVPAFFWQPVPRWDDPQLPYAHAVDQLTEPTVSIADCLDDHQEVYLPDEHTNEQGANLVARCLWDEIGPAVRSWYARRGRPRQPVPERKPSDITPALTALDLGLTPADLGVGWSDSPPVPNLAETCLGEVQAHVPKVRGSAGYALSLPGKIGRATASIVTFPTEAEARAALDRTTERPMFGCIQKSVTDYLGVTGGGIAWAPTTPDLSLHDEGIVTWTGTGFIRYLGGDSRVFLGVAVRGRSVIALEVVGPAMDDVAAAGAAAVRKVVAG